MRVRVDLNMDFLEEIISRASEFEEGSNKVDYCY